MAIERMPITPAVLTWARERAGYKLEALATKRRDFKKIAEWGKWQRAANLSATRIAR